MGQNTLSQSDYRIFKSTICLEQNDEILIQIRGKQKLIDKYWVDMVKNGCGHSVLKTPKLPVYQGKMNEIN